MEIVRSCIPVVPCYKHVVLCALYYACVFFIGKHTDPLVDESLKDNEFIWKYI